MYSRTERGEIIILWKIAALCSPVTQPQNASVIETRNISVPL